MKHSQTPKLFRITLFVLCVSLGANSFVFAKGGKGFFRKIMTTAEDYHLDIALPVAVVVSLGVYALYRWRKARRTQLVSEAERSAARGKKMYETQRERETLILHYTGEFAKLYNISRVKAQEYAVKYVEGEFVVRYDELGNPIVQSSKAGHYGNFTVREIKRMWDKGTIGRVKKRFASKMGRAVREVSDADVKWMRNVATLSRDDAMCAICYRSAGELLRENKGSRVMAILPCGHVFCEEEISQWAENTCPLDRSAYIERRSFTLK